MLKPDTVYDIRVEAGYYVGGFSIGNLTLGGTAAGTVTQQLALQTRPSNPEFPLNVGGDEVSAFELTRMAVAMPSMLTSLHQVGFDANSWILSVIHQRAPQGSRQGRFIVWGIGARRDEKGGLVPDPDTRRTLALNGRYDGDAFTLAGSDFAWTVGGSSIPVEDFEIRGQLGPDLRVRSGASFFATAAASSSPSFGSQLVLGGLLSNVYESLFLTGTYLTRPYDSGGSANRRPQGLRVSMVERALGGWGWGSRGAGGPARPTACPERSLPS
jgi:hypothetical protein